MPDSILPILKEASQTPGLLKQIYGDLAKPGVAQVGKALSTVFGLGNTILWPLTLLNEKAKIALEHNLEKYRKQLEDVPIEKIIPVSPEVGVPVSEKLSYVSDKELSDLYANLLAKASTTDTVSQAHPSFVNVINNLSPDEALLLRALSNVRAIPFITAKWFRKNSNEWVQVADLITDLEQSVQITFPDNIVAYFSNFEGLGLIRIRRDIFCLPVDVYSKLEAKHKPIFEKDLPPNVTNETHDLRFEKGRLDVTPFGDLFLDSCLKKLKET